MNFLKRRRWVVLLVAVALAGLGAAGGKFAGHKGDEASKQNASPTNTAVSVTTDTATARPVRRVVSAVGSLWGWDEVAMTPKLEGRVVRVYKDVGTW